MNTEKRIIAKSSVINGQLSWILKSLVFSISMVMGNPVFAQSIVTDGTTNTQINGNCAGSCQITGTDIVNNNLFHSFQRFNVDTGATVTFIDLGVNNIVTRITGGEISNIDGTLGVQGSANLFLLNPSGIIFGKNASLNISGSFLATTADSLIFDNGQQFSAITKNSPQSLLSVNVPIGLQFGGNPRQIEVKGSGNNLFLNPDFTINSELRPVGLEVKNAQTLALIGGDILLDGGNLTAKGGKIELGSVGEGFVGINSITSGWNFDYTDISAFNDITLSNASSLDVSGNDAGTIELRGQNITLTDGSSLLAKVLTQGGGEINLRAEDTVNLTGIGDTSFIPYPVPPFTPMSSSIYVEIDPGAVGDGSSRLNIFTNNLEIFGGAQIGLSMAGLGNGGSLNVVAENIEMEFGTPFAPSSIFVATLPFFGSEEIDVPALGQAGELNIDTKTLRVLNGAQIIASTFGLGDAGNLNINAEDIQVIGFNPGGPSSIVSASEIPPAGKGGNVTINTQRLLVADGGQISTSTKSFTSPAGNLVINASELIELTGQVEQGRSGLFANAFSLRNPNTGQVATSQGEGGSIIVNTPKLILQDGATINVSNNASNPNLPTVAPGLGGAGNVEINADTILLDNQSILTAETQKGDKGNILLNSSEIILRNNSLITANAKGESQGGNVNISTRYLFAVPKENSDITANAENSVGGRVTISAEGILGIQFREEQTSLSDITVTSELGPAFSGVVEIRNEYVDPQASLVELPDQVTDASTQIAQGCSAERGNVFTVTGRGGLPENPNQTLQGRNLWEDLRPLDNTNSALTPEQNQQQSKQETIAPIIEAQELVVDSQGKIILVAQNIEPQAPTIWHQSSCNAKR
jgi:filamentous hemagglutinin family protein